LRNFGSDWRVHHSLAQRKKFFGLIPGDKRTVVVTYNPRTATKQKYNFERKLNRLQNGLFEIRSKVRGGNKRWASK
jgi:hypothetical protein